MEEIKLDVQIRDKIGKRQVRIVRKEDFVPGIVYGGKRKPTTIQMDRRTYERIRRQHQGESIVYHLNVVEGDKQIKDYSAVIKEEQHDPVTDKVLHVDFKRISLKEKISVKVPIEPKGEAIGVKKDGGSLEHVLWELEIECLPTQIPQHIEVDVSHLEVGETICVKDIVLADEILVKNDPDVIVISISAPMKEDVPEEEAASESEPEVIKQKKDDAEEKKD